MDIGIVFTGLKELLYECVWLFLEYSFFIFSNEKLVVLKYGVSLESIVTAILFLLFLAFYDPDILSPYLIILGRLGNIRCFLMM